MMKEIFYTVKNALGINPRPALLLAKTMRQFTSNITIRKEEAEADGKNVYDILTLNVRVNDTITVKASGQDEEAAIEAARLFLTQKL
jgi:phosphotransferase system HPr (HPr) family protein